jgi:hypothetical protein
MMHLNSSCIINFLLIDFKTGLNTFPPKQDCIFQSCFLQSCLPLLPGSRNVCGSYTSNVMAIMGRHQLTTLARVYEARTMQQLRIQFIAHLSICRKVGTRRVKPKPRPGSVGARVTVHHWTLHGVDSWHLPQRAFHAWSWSLWLLLFSDRSSSSRLVYAVPFVEFDAPFYSEPCGVRWDTS